MSNSLAGEPFTKTEALLEERQPLIHLLYFHPNYICSKLIDQVFFTCSFTLIVWKWLVEWSSIQQGQPGSFYDLLDFLNMGAGCKRFQKLQLSFVYVTIWMILNARNDIIFMSERWATMFSMDDINMLTYNQIKNIFKL